MNFLALGDSYTIGEGVEPEGRWPVQLAHALRAVGIALTEPRIIATTGWTCDELSAAMDAAEPLGEWEFASLLIGVNDQYRGYPPADYAPRYAALLERAIALVGARPGRVLALSIPDWGVTPFARRELRSPRRIATELDACNGIAGGICAARGVAFVDITGISRDNGDTPQMLAADGLHPSSAMYARWAQAALPVAKALLTR